MAAAIVIAMPIIIAPAFAVTIVAVSSVAAMVTSLRFVGQGAHHNRHRQETQNLACRSHSHHFSSPYSGVLNRHV